MSHAHVALMLCNSDELARFTLAHDPAPPPIAVVPNGVDLAHFPASPVPADPVVVVVANLIGYKRHDRFLRALAEVVTRVPEARAVLVGEGPERPRLEAMAVGLGLGERVRFAGARADVRPFLAEARVVALTSDHEGLPNALLEAMASGRPVVATHVGGVPELVRDGFDGLLADPDPASVARALIALLGSPGEAERMGASARERAAAYDWPVAIGRAEELYRRVLAGERFPRGRSPDVRPRGGPGRRSGRSRRARARAADPPPRARRAERVDRGRSRARARTPVDHRHARTDRQPMTTARRPTTSWPSTARSTTTTSCAPSRAARVSDAVTARYNTK